MNNETENLNESKMNAGGACGGIDAGELASDMASQEQQVDISLDGCAAAESGCGASESGTQSAEEESVLSDIEKKLEEALAAAEKNKDLYMRAVADLDTYKRKVQREKAELSKFALQPLVEELLPSLDHLDMAIQAANAVEGGKNIAMGVEMVRAQVKKVFASFGVEEISAQGREFDPKLEDAVSHEPSDVVEENKVIKVVRAGYTMNGRLLRPSSVVVSSGKGK